MKKEKIRTLARLKAKVLTKKETKKISGGIKQHGGGTVSATTSTIRTDRDHVTDEGILIDD